MFNQVSSNMIQTLKFSSVNVNGLNCPHKRKKIFNQLRKLNSDVICLQETHIKEKDTHLPNNKKLGVHFYASDEQKKKRGVVTYIIKELQPKLLEKTKDGHILMVDLILVKRNSSNLYRRS